MYDFTCDVNSSVNFLFLGGEGLIIVNDRMHPCCSVVIFTDWHEFSLSTKPRALVDSIVDGRGKSCDCIMNYM